MNDNNCSRCYTMWAIRHPFMHFLRHLFAPRETKD